jgi:hypothetical protein
MGGKKMATARSVLGKLKSSDGKIRVKTLSGVSALIAAIALLVGVLPAVGYHGTTSISPDPLNEGGGSGKCSITTGGLPSIAGNEFHINNPTVGKHTSADGVIQIEVSDTANGRVFEFTSLDDDFVVYDVVVNGGPKSNHYDYDAKGGAVPHDVDLHAPRKNPNSLDLHNLSHINLCYDVPGLTEVPCDVVPPVRIDGTGVLTIGEVTIFQNSLHGCTDKRASFFIEDEVATLNFLGDGTNIVAGRLDITKDFDKDGDNDRTNFDDLQYNGPGNFVDLQWCDVRDKDTIPDEDGLFDGNEFDDVLAEDEYPSLVGVLDGAVAATACKVAEHENAAGVQYNVVYFEFVDPQFR